MSTILVKVLQKAKMLPKVEAELAHRVAALLKVLPWVFFGVTLSWWFVCGTC